MVNVGIIGVGYWGPNLVRSFHSIPGVKVVVCSDLDDQRLLGVTKVYPDITTTKDYKELLSNNEVDAVVVATPIHTHFTIAKDCLQAGKHTLVEKPITADSKQAQELMEIADQQNKILMVDHLLEFSPYVQKMKELITRGELGELLTLDMIRVNLGLFQDKVNIIWDLAPHDLSVLLQWVDSTVVSIQAIGHGSIRENIEDDVYIHLTFENKVRAHIHVSWLSPRKIRRMTIVGNKKMAVFDDTAGEEKLKIYNKGVTLEKNSLPKLPYFTTYEEFVTAYKYGDTYAPQVQDKELLSQMTSHFIECIKNNKTPLTDGKSGLRVVRILEAAQESLQNNGKVVNIDDH